ncbi:MAG: excinuclease ABC subunit UvrA, partial [Candidatus Omnitrophica bacterium]|nr:excinuclease ABC subunit UvrA [Candidatus Omnitrophota bacterium]
MKKIVIRGAKEHNLKNIDLELPRDQLIVFTGVSGSGKSSLAFDTIYAEGQRRYVESLSAYARQFLGQMEKPKVDLVEGLSPAISIEQKSTSKNPRSTVGTVTEIYDYLRVLFARCGTAYCPAHGEPLSSQTLDQIVDQISELDPGTRFMILAPKVRERKGEYKDLLEAARKDGFVRARINGEVMELDQTIKLNKKMAHTIELVIDRLVMKPDIQSRLADSVEIALQQGGGVLLIAVPGDSDRMFSTQNACPECGFSIGEMTPQHFSFNHPLGMCPVCHGLGRKMELDPSLIVPDPDRSVIDGAILPWKNVFQNGKDSFWGQRVRRNLEHFAEENRISLAKPWKQLTKRQQDMLLYGEKIRGGYRGIIPVLERWYERTSSEGFRNHILQTYMRRVPCESCGGGRLRQEYLAARFGGKAIHEVTDMDIASALQFFGKVTLTPRQEKIAGSVLKEILDRLMFLQNVGLDYLTLSRAAPSLSGGEAQRIRLASQIGSALVGVLYVLDEPSIGLHQRDNRRLIETLLQLRDLGNTVL